MTKKYVQNILRYILGGIFLIAAISKFINPYPLGDFLNSLRFLPGYLIILGVYVLSCFELALSLLLLFDYQRALIASIFLFFISIATIYSIWLYFSGVRLACGCFGGFLDRQIGILYFLTNGLIIIGFSTYLWLAKENKDV